MRLPRFHRLCVLTCCFLVFSFVISGFCLLFGWMLFLAESLSCLCKYFFLVRIRCSVYIINSPLAGNCMCTWAPYLFDYRPRLTKFFSSFHAACIFYFFTLSKDIGDVSDGFRERGALGHLNFWGPKCDRFGRFPEKRKVCPSYV